MRHRTIGPAQAAMLSLAVALAAAAPAAAAPADGGAVRAEAPALPRVQGPIPITAASRPWAAAATAVEPVDLAAAGYVEEEYFLSGTARVFARPAPGALTSLGAGPYVTRILVRRPRDPRKASGSVIVEPLNPSVRYDSPLVWGSAWRSFIRYGDTWVGMTAKPVAIAALKEFDAARYRPLGFPNPLPPERTCGQERLRMPLGNLPPGSTPATENGLLWDALSQLGALLDSDSRANPLRDIRPTRLYMSGDSQSGAFILTYANTFQRLVLDRRGAPLWDGYLAAVASSGATPISQCEADLPPGDPRGGVAAVGVPTIVMISESDMRRPTRQPDSDVAPRLFRRYEVAGSSHIHEGDDAGTPAPADIARTSGRGMVSAAPCAQNGKPGNDVPFGMLLGAAFANLDRWSREGVPAPRAEPLALTGYGTAMQAFVRDDVGNTRGGMRSPAIDAPLARYRERMDGPGICELWGWRDPLDPATLRARYGDRAGYVTAVRRSADRLVSAQWLERADADTLVARAQAAETALPDGR